MSAKTHSHSHTPVQKQATDGRTGQNLTAPPPLLPPPKKGQDTISEEEKERRRLVAQLRQNMQDLTKYIQDNQDILRQNTGAPGGVTLLGILMSKMPVRSYKFKGKDGAPRSLESQTFSAYIGSIHRKDIDTEFIRGNAVVLEVSPPRMRSDDSQTFAPSQTYNPSQNTPATGIIQSTTFTPDSTYTSVLKSNGSQAALSSNIPQGSISSVTPRQARNQPPSGQQSVPVKSEEYKDDTPHHSRSINASDSQAIVLADRQTQITHGQDSRHTDLTNVSFKIPTEFYLHQNNVYQFSTNSPQSLKNIAVGDMVLISGIKAQASTPTDTYPTPTIFLNASSVERCLGISIGDISKEFGLQFQTSWFEKIEAKYNENDPTTRWIREPCALVLNNPLELEDYANCLAKGIPVVNMIVETTNEKRWIFEKQNKEVHMWANISCALLQWSGNYTKETAINALLNITMYADVLGPFGITNPHIWKILGPFIFQNLSCILICIVDVMKTNRVHKPVNSGTNERLHFATHLQAQTMILDVQALYKKIGIPVSKEYVENRFSVKGFTDTKPLQFPPVICMDETTIDMMTILNQDSMEYRVIINASMNKKNIEFLRQITPQEGDQLMRVLSGEIQEHEMEVDQNSLVHQINISLSNNTLVSYVFAIFEFKVEEKLEEKKKELITQFLYGSSADESPTPMLIDEHKVLQIDDIPADDRLSHQPLSQDLGGTPSTSAIKVNGPPVKNSQLMHTQVSDTTKRSQQTPTLPKSVSVAGPAQKTMSPISASKHMSRVTSAAPTAGSHTTPQNLPHSSSSNLFLDETPEEEEALLDELQKTEKQMQIDKDQKIFTTTATTITTTGKVVDQEKKAPVQRVVPRDLRSTSQTRPEFKAPPPAKSLVAPKIEPKQELEPQSYEEEESQMDQEEHTTETGEDDAEPEASQTVRGPSQKNESKSKTQKRDREPEDQDQESDEGQSQKEKKKKKHKKTKH